MSVQSLKINRSQIENNILDLELKYYKIILKILKSEDFTDDLQLIEKEISDNYAKFDNLWNLKNKIKIPAERVVRHHLYTQMPLITGVFPSPLSSDFGIRTDDAIICVDIKTIDTNNNAGDLKAIAVEKNQTSFDNKEYPYIEIPHNMNDFDDYSRLPILTYVVRIVYTDNNVHFSLCRDPEWYTISLACIPNGKLSRLFSYNIVENCKTYNYYSAKNDGADFEPIFFKKNEIKNDLIVDGVCAERGLQKIDLGKKTAYYDSKHKVVWWKTSISNRDCVAPVKSGSSVRFDKTMLKERYDSLDNPWNGYEEWMIVDNPYLRGQHLIGR